jgi:uncharacterized protein (TIRG00374 family)
LRRRWLVPTGKALLLVGLCALLIERGHLSLEALGTAIARWPWVLAGWIATAAATLIAIVRWHFLMSTQELEVPFRRTLSTALIGAFFGVALPGMASGDLVKGFYITRVTPGRGEDAISTVLFDRVLGLSGLILLACASLALAAPRGLPADGLGRSLQFAVGASGLCVIAFFGALLGVSEERDPILAALRRRSGRHKIIDSIRQVFEGVRVYHRERLVTFCGLTASIVVHTLMVTAWVCYVKAMALEGIPGTALFVVVPTALLVTALPIAPAGIGIGHTAFLAVFALLGSSHGADLYNLAMAYLLLQGAIGGLVYVTVRSHEPPPTVGTPA